MLGNTFQDCRFTADEIGHEAEFHGLPGSTSFDFATQLYRCLLLDLLPLSYDTRALDACLGRFRSDPLSILRSLDCLSDAYIEYVSFKRSGADFIGLLNRSQPVVRHLCRLLQGAIGGILMRDTSSVKFWRQVFAFLLRPDYPDLQLERPDAIQSWISTSDTHFSGDATDLGRALFKFVDDKFVVRCRDYFRPHHGPGSVTFKVGNRLKHRRLTHNEKDLLLRHCPLTQTVAGNDLTKFLPIGPDDDRVSYLTSVPKSWKKRRVIGIETANRLYLQLGLKEGLFAAMQQDSFLQRHVDFEHAELAHKLCYKASYGGYATIDLSSASDSVSVDHVRGALYWAPSLLSDLLAVRATHVTTDGKDRIRTNTFGTMGNGTTFPIETLVFCACCIVAIENCGASPEASNFRVYGDDIIIEEAFASSLLSVLARFNFTVNVEKSFFGARTKFRESCGVEYLNGKEITPLRLPRTFSVPSGTFDAIAWCVDLANRALQHGYYRIHSVISRWFREYPMVFKWVEDSGYGLSVLHSPCNYHLPRLRNEVTGKLTPIYTALAVSTKVRENGGVAFYEWLLSTAHSVVSTASFGGDFTETSRFATRDSHFIDVFLPIDFL